MSHPAQNDSKDIYNGRCNHFNGILFDYCKSIILDVIYSAVSIVLQFYHDQKKKERKEFDIFVRLDKILTESLTFLIIYAPPGE